MKTGLVTQIENGSDLLTERPRTSVTFTLSMWPPDVSPSVEMPRLLSAYCVGPEPLNVISLMVFAPSRTWMLRIPAFDVKVMFGSTYRVPTFTHFALTGLLLIRGAVHVGVYFVLQRCVATRGCAAEATPDAPATTAHATTTVEMALRNSHNPPAMESLTLIAPAQKQDRQDSTIKRHQMALNSVA